MPWFYFSLYFFPMRTESWMGKKCYQSVCVIPKGKEISCHTGSSICGVNMICGGLARSLAHTPIAEEHHLLFRLLGGSLLAPSYFTVTTLAQTSGLKCALHWAVGKSMFPVNLIPTCSGGELTAFVWAVITFCLCWISSPKTRSLLETFMEYIRFIHMISLLSMFLASIWALHMILEGSKSCCLTISQTCSWWQIKLLWNYRFKTNSHKCNIF